MRLRLATLDDQEVIARLHCASWEATFSKIIPELVKVRGDQFPRRVQQWGELLKDKNLFTYIAVDNEEILGFGQGGSVRKELGNPASEGELHRIYIASDRIGRGIGKRLINMVATSLKAQGKQSLFVVAWSINTPARKVYEHLGAKFIREIVQEKDGFDNSQTVYVWRDINIAIEATS